MRIGFIAIVIGCGLLAGCGGGPPDWGIDLTGRDAVRGSGDWDDVRAAVLVGAERAECALLGASEPESGRRLFRLRSVRGETVWLEVVRSEGADGGVEMRCRFGHFGDVEREGRLMRAVAARLRALGGVDYSPVS